MSMNYPLNNLLAGIFGSARPVSLVLLLFNYGNFGTYGNFGNREDTFGCCALKRSRRLIAD